MPVVFSSPPDGPDNWKNEFFEEALKWAVPDATDARRNKAAEDYRAMIDELEGDITRRALSPTVGPAKQAATELAEKCEALALEFQKKTHVLGLGGPTLNPSDHVPRDKETEEFVALVLAGENQIRRIAGDLRERAKRYSSNLDEMKLHDVRFGTEAQAVAYKAKQFFARHNPKRLTKTPDSPFHQFVWISYQLVHGRLSGKHGDKPGSKFLSAIRQVLK